MIDIKTVEFAVADEINSSPLLNMQYYPRRIDKRLF
jgi:hypothetical protein